MNYILDLEKGKWKVSQLQNQQGNKRISIQILINFFIAFLIVSLTCVMGIGFHLKGVRADIWQISNEK